MLSRERLRGTVGYMSPELILMGHSSKATDVFAAGVVRALLTREAREKNMCCLSISCIYLTFPFSIHKC